MLKARGAWQAEALREMKEMEIPLTVDGVISYSNSLDDQMTEQIGEGSTPGGRKHLRCLLRATDALITNATKEKK